MVARTWLDHNGLFLVKGIGKIAGDSASPEQSLQTVSLMSGAITLAPNGWSPVIASVKNNGIWADSPISDGRQLLAGARGNVIEKITIIISANSYLDAQKQLTALNLMAQDCLDFWQTQTQIEPVYLAWWANCGTDYQYALLYDIELAPTYENSINPTLTVVMTLEREPAWRAVPPGANPKAWTYYVNTAHTPFNKTVAGMITSTDDLIFSQNVRNRLEWNPVGYSSLLSQNYVDVPATAIPGDAPALVSVAFETVGGGTGLSGSQILCARSTKPTSLLDRTGASFPQAYTFNGGDAFSTGTFTKTIDATCGVFSNGSAVNRYLLANAAIVGGTTTTIEFSANGTVRFLDLDTMRGTYVVFLRCKQLNGAAGDVQAQLTFLENFGTIYTGQFNNLPLVGAAGGGCINRFDALYLGTLTLPAGAKTYNSPDGLGLNVFLRTAAGRQGSISVNIKNTAGVNRSVEILDLILLPIDEPLIQIVGPDANNERYFQYDTTGYLAHGNPQTMSVLAQPTTNETGMTVVQTLGQDLTLIPRVNNRLYFLIRALNTSPGGNYYSAPESTANNLTVRLNIVPRWYGIRDT